MILQISKSGEHTLPDVDEPDGGVIPVPSYIRPCALQVQNRGEQSVTYGLYVKY